MKKALKLILALSAAMLCFASLSAETLFNGKALKTGFILANNHQYGSNFQVINHGGNVLPADYVAKKGDKITLHIEGTFSKDLVLGANGYSFQVVIADTTEAAHWYTELSEYLKYEKEIKAGEKITFDFVFNINENSTTSAEKNGAEIIFGSADEQTVQSVFKTSVYTIKIER